MLAPPSQSCRQLANRRTFPVEFVNHHYQKVSSEAFTLPHESMISR